MVNDASQNMGNYILWSLSFFKSAETGFRSMIKSLKGSSTTSPTALGLLAALALLLDIASALSVLALNNETNTSFWRSFLSSPSGNPLSFVINVPFAILN